MHLGIDTAADSASLALLRGDEVIAQRAWCGERTMSRELLAQLDALLAEAGVSRQQIAAIAVIAGPGQYGPLRTGLATAQGLSLALDVPLAGVGRLEADALPHLAPGRTVVAVHDAGRAGVAWAAYVPGTDGLRCVAEPRITTVEEAAQQAPSEALWCGELTDALRAARDAVRDSGRRSGDTDAEALPGGRAVAAVRLARMQHAYGDPALVDALYLRSPSITRAKPRPA